MLRLRDGQGTLWDESLPPEVRVFSEELTAIDALLDDDRFLAAFSQRLMTKVGRPTIPMETYLRLMYINHRHTLGYETPVKEVADSLSWRRSAVFASMSGSPHSTTRIKLTKRCGPELLEDLNETLLRTAVEREVLRSRRLRVDTTATEADVRYPTDSGLCAHAVSRLGRAVTRVKAAGLATRTRFRDRRRKAGKIIRKVSHALGGRPQDRRPMIEKLTGDVHRLVEAAAREASAVIPMPVVRFEWVTRRERSSSCPWNGQAGALLVAEVGTNVGALLQQGPR